MLRKLIISLISVICLTAFSSSSDQLNIKLEKLPQHYSEFDVKMGWAITNDNNGISIDGVIKNIRYATMENVEVWVYLIDASGNRIDRDAYLISPIRLDLNDSAPFSIKISKVAPSDSKLIFIYKYVGADGGGDSGGGSGFWMNSFESKL